MNKDEFIKRLKPILPQTTNPIVPTQVIPLHDGLWVTTIEVAKKEGDPIRVAKVSGLMNEQNKSGEIHIMLLEKADYAETDLERAVVLIQEADGLVLDSASCTK